MRVLLVLVFAAGTMASFAMIIATNGDAAAFAFMACLLGLLGTIAQGAYAKAAARRKIWRDENAW